MRDMKVRAWDIDNKHFIYFDLNDPDESLFGRHGVLQNTVIKDWQQFTGLKSKSGVEIFEGDIVKGICSKNPENVCEGLKMCDAMGKELVGFIDYAPQWCQFRFTTDEITYLNLCTGINQLEVIGNIYENPELLKSD